jgi:predicted lipoprotein with Yx(FWY)xxD motif
MKRLLIAGAVLAAAGALAACGGGGGGDSSNAAGATPSGSGTATVASEQIGDFGSVLVDSSGQALYASDQEQAAGQVLCTDGCMSFWTPLTIDGKPSGNALTGDLGVAERPDGTQQVTYNGKLLYSFSEDQPGEVTGDGFEDAFGGQTLTWHVVHVDSAADSTGSGTGSGGSLPGYEAPSS